MNPRKDPFLIQEFHGGMKDSTVQNFSYRRNLGDTFITDERPTLWLGKIISSSKFNALFIVLFILFLVLFTRLSYLQIIKGKDYRDLAEGNRLRLEYLPADRGIIFDRWHTPLVGNVASFSLFLDQSKISEIDTEKEKVRELLNSLLADYVQDPTIIDQLLEDTSSQPILIMENMGYNKALKLMISTEKLESLKVVIDPYRSYLPDLANAHLLGYTSRITNEEKDFYLKKGYLLIERVGRTGIEGYYEDELRGELGLRQTEVDSLGRQQKVITEQPADSGKNIVLAIDNGLQQIIIESLKKLQPNRAVAVVALDPNSGKVRALVSWPTFDHKAFSKNLTVEEYNKIINDPLKPLFNRVIAGEYPSGSTIKIVEGAAALKEKLIDRFTQINSTGGIWYDKWFFPDWKAGGHGLTNIIKALAESVNTFFYYLALEDFEGHHGLGLERLLGYFKQVGLGQISGIDLAGERPGFLPSAKWKKETKNEIWYPGDTLHLVIGQGDLSVTPLQVANYTAIVANGGTLYEPQLVEEIIDPATGQTEIIQPKIINSRIFDKADLDIITEGMRATVLVGSARSLANYPIKVAGKTGTAQVGGDKSTHAWFTSFAPYENPELILTILVENGGEGSDSAVPIARDVWRWYYENRIK